MFISTIFRKLRAVNQSDPRLLDLMILYLAVKVALIALALLGHEFLPFNWTLYHANLVFDNQGQVFDLQGLPELFRPFNTWDTQHYLLLAQRGYGADPSSDAFYPLYPYLIKLFTPVFFNRSLIAAWFIANLFSLLVSLYMYKLACLFYSKEQAFRATVLLLAFPTAFFMSVAYSEAIYLSPCLMAFYYLFRRDIPKSCFFCFLPPLARAQGLLLVVPVGVLFFQDAMRKGDNFRTNVTRAARTYLLPLFATVLGAVAYFAICRWQLGGFFEGLKSQHGFVAENSLSNIFSNIFSPYHWFLNNFINIHLHLHDYTTSAIDRAAFLICAPILIGIYRTQNKALFAYAAVSLLVPAFAGSFMSYTRFLLMVFPIFLFVGAYLKKSEYYLAVPMFAVQVFLYLLHTDGYWVA